MLVLLGVYLAQMILRGAAGAAGGNGVGHLCCEIPEGPFRQADTFSAGALLVRAADGLTTLALNLTGDLLPWEQNSYWATNIRMAYLDHMPVAGPWLAKLALGGTQIGTLSLTRFLVLHAGVFTPALLGLMLLHAERQRGRDWKRR